MDWIGVDEHLIASSEANLIVPPLSAVDSIVVNFRVVGKYAVILCLVTGNCIF